MWAACPAAAAAVAAGSRLLCHYRLEQSAGLCWKGETRCLGHPPLPLHGSCNLNSVAMTAGDADVNSNIRFQSSLRTVITTSKEQRCVKAPTQDKISKGNVPSKATSLLIGWLSVAGMRLQAWHRNNQAHLRHSRASAQSQKMFLDEVLSDCFWFPLCWREPAGSSAALGVHGSSLALAFHTRSAVKACDRLQTLPPTAPLHPRSCCLANYEYSLAMKVILSDMQLSSGIMSGVLFAELE